MKYSISLFVLLVLTGCTSVTPTVDIGISPTGTVYTNTGAEIDVDVADKTSALQRCREMGFDDVRTYRDVKRTCHVGIMSGVNCRVQRVILDYECVDESQDASEDKVDEVVMTLTMDHPIPLAVFTEIDVMARLRNEHKDVANAVLENQAIRNAALASCRMHNENVNFVTPISTDVECLESRAQVCVSYEIQRRFRCSDTMSEFFNR